MAFPEGTEPLPFTQMYLYTTCDIIVRQLISYSSLAHNLINDTIFIFRRKGIRTVNYLRSPFHLNSSNFLFNIF